MGKVFQPLQLKNMTVKNRIIRSATNTHMGNYDGTLSEQETQILSELAENEVGIIISGNFYVSGENSKVSTDQPSISSDQFIPQLASVVDQIRKSGCRLILQMSHAGALGCVDNLVGPSEIKQESGRFVKSITQAEIKQIQKDFIAGANRAQKAGFDGVQLHCAHGYLLGEFISPIDNRREDQYGGNVVNRFRIIKEIVIGIKEKCGNDYPIFIKINCNTPGDNDTYEQDILYIIQEFKMLQIDALEISGYDFMKKNMKERNYYLDIARRIHRSVEIPLILVGGIRSLEDMEEVLQEEIDLVSLSRPLICEPDLILKLKEGQAKAKCISCNCCFTYPQTRGKRCALH